MFCWNVLWSTVFDLHLGLDEVPAAEVSEANAAFGAASE